MHAWLASFGIDYEFSASLGTLGVQIFFALSGFLITTKMLDSEGRDSGFSLRDFYLRRVFRILPASLSFLLIVALLAAIGVLDITPGRWISTVLFFANYSPATPSWYVGHFWSLAVEEHFYMLWPLAFVLLASTRRRLLAVCALALTVAIWRAISFKFGIASTPPAVFWGRTDIVGDSIMCGVATSLAYRSAALRPLLTKWLSNVAATAILVGAAVCVEAIPVADWKIAFALLSVKFVLLPLAILSTVVRPQGVIGRLLEWEILRWIGLISYSLYLYQQLFLVEGNSTADSLRFVQTAPMNIALAVAAGYLSYRLIETPMIRVGQSVIRARARARAR